MAEMFDHRAFDDEAVRGLRRGRRPVAFLYRTAIGTDKELGSASVVAVAAADIGVERLDLVHETEPEQEFQRAIDGRRFS